MELGELSELIKSRRSIRKWQDKEVPESLLLQALELATHASNAGNRQNWRFFLIMNRGVIGRIADAVQASADLVASWPEGRKMGPEAVGYAQRAAFFRSAPAAIAVATPQYQSIADKILELRHDRDPEAARMRAGRNSSCAGIQSAASAIAILLLIFQKMGLGACWMTGPMQAKEEIEKILGVQPGHDLVAFIPVGYPAEKPDLKPRQPIPEVCTVIR